MVAEMPAQNSKRDAGWNSPEKEWRVMQTHCRDVVARLMLSLVRVL